MKEVNKQKCKCYCHKPGILYIEEPKHCPDCFVPTPKQDKPQERKCIYDGDHSCNHSDCQPPQERKKSVHNLSGCKCSKGVPLEYCLGYSKPPQEECKHDKEGAFKKHCDNCGEQNLCYYCVDKHECHPPQKEGWDGWKVENWKEEFDKKFVAQQGKKRVWWVADPYRIKSFIDLALAKQRQEVEEMIEGKLEWHKHNSIPNLTGSEDEGCITCMKNKALEDVLSQLRTKKGGNNV